MNKTYCENCIYWGYENDTDVSAPYWECLKKIETDCGTSPLRARYSMENIGHRYEIFNKNNNCEYYEELKDGFWVSWFVQDLVVISMVIFCAIIIYFCIN